MVDKTDISLLQLKNIEPTHFDPEYETESQHSGPNSDKEPATSSAMVSSRSFNSCTSFYTARSDITAQLDPSNIAKKLFDVFKASEKLCESSQLKFSNLEFNESCKFIIEQIASTSSFIIPWNAIKLLLAISWIKILESFDNPNKIDLEAIKVLYMSQILKFTKPFLTVQRFAEILFHHPYKKIDKFLNATVRIISIRESDHMDEPNDCLYTDDVIALIKMLEEKINQMNLEAEEEIWSSSETEKSDKKDYVPQVADDDEKRDNRTFDEANKRDFDENDENTHSKRAKIQG